MKLKRINNEGMTLPELIVAGMMLTAFTGIAVMVTQYTARFFRPSNEMDVVQDFALINNIFDSIIEILSEPGINKNDILDFECTNSPSSTWAIPSIDDASIPISYEICVEPTSLPESEYSELVSDGRPGIYILYSKIVNKQSTSIMPVRRIFCRPKPFCISKEQ